MQTAVSVSAGSTVKMVDEAGDRFVDKIDNRISYGVYSSRKKWIIAGTDCHNAFTIRVEAELTSKSLCGSINLYQ
jgi:hypothetical protein